MTNANNNFHSSCFCPLRIRIYLVSSGSIALPDYWTQLAVVLTATALGILYWGFKPQIDRLFKEKGKFQKAKSETAPLRKEETQEASLLPENVQITKLSIDDSLLDEIYEQARRKAIDIYHDAQLSFFAIQVYPFTGPSVNIYLDFYSKWADKKCTLRARSDASWHVEHSPPDKHPKYDSGRQVFTTLPWKESPQWMEFLNRAYAKIGPFAPAIGTSYHLFAYPTQNKHWSLGFSDGFSGKEYSFEWDGKGLDENSIKQLS